MVLLVSISSKNIHKSLSVWCLKAASKDRDISVYETDINENFFTILNDIYSYKPKIIAFSCYIWNISLIKKLTLEIKKILPSVIIVAGGPEVAFNKEVDPFDCIIRGRETSFLSFLNDYKDGNKIKEFYSGYEKPFNELISPYTDEYFESFKNEKISDIKNRLVYYESSRGCPFNCSYCLSSADDNTEYLDLNRVFTELKTLVKNGAKTIKFVDRTFNANLKRAIKILNFIKEENFDCTFHFEIAGDIFNDEFFDVIKNMPKNKVQFEIGIQTITEKALIKCNRKTDTNKLFNAITKLVSFNNAHIHIDLIAGLINDSYEGILNSLDFCFNTNANMIQLGFLKLLKGSLLAQQDHKTKFLNEPPYEIVCSEFFSFNELNKLRRFDKIIDYFYNSGVFKNSFSFALSLFNKPQDLLNSLYEFLEGKILNTLSQKDAYYLLLDFLNKHNKDYAENVHYIKLDALSFNPKGKRMGFDSTVNLEVEKEYKAKSGSKNVRAEYFEFDKKTRVFDYENKDPITKSYLVM